MHPSDSTPKLQIVARKDVKRSTLARPAESPLSHGAVEDLLKYRGEPEALRLAYQCGYRRGVALVLTDACRRIVDLRRRVERLEQWEARRVA